MQTYIETDCTIEHEGRKFESGGAVVTPEYIVAYVGKPTGNYRHSSKEYALNDWHGNKLGECYIGSRWPVNSYMGSHMCQIYATVNGVTYTGRGFGEGMIFKGRRVKA